MRSRSTSRRVARTVAILAVVATSVCRSATPDVGHSATIDMGGCRAGPSQHTLASLPIFHDTIYARAEKLLGQVAPDGALGLNRDYESGLRREWFIEIQRDGAYLIEAGLALGRPDLTEAGLRAFDWGFRRQRDGGFPGTGDPFHSVSMFVSYVARALIEIRESGDQAQISRFGPVVNAMLPQLHEAARWLVRPEILRRGKSNDRPYTHRRWILAAALGQTAVLTHDDPLGAVARTFANDGLSLQREDGVNPEKGGFDVSYQMVGVMEASRFYTTLRCEQPDDSALKPRVARMIDRAALWEIKRLEPDGALDASGSTRVGREAGRSGRTKSVNTKEVIQAFAYAHEITGREEFLGAARSLARAGQ
jgi:hypothetical protein